MSTVPSPPAPVAPTKLTVREWLALAICAALLLLLRAWAFTLPLETDEANYAVIAARLLAGDRLYVNVWDHQPPGVFMLFAAAIAALGDAPLVFRGLAAVFSLTSLALTFMILRRVAGSAAAILGAVLFALASADPGVAGEGCNREIYMNALVLAAWWIVFRERGPTRRRLLLGGATLGAASLLKTIIAVHWIVIACWLVIESRAARWDEGRRRSYGGFRGLALFALGPALIWTVTFCVFAWTSRGALFIDAVFGFNLAYSDSDEPFLMRFVRSFQPERHPFIFESARALWVCGILATAQLAVAARRKRDARRLPILLLILASYIALCLPAQFWPHYYYLMLSPLVLATAVVVCDLAEQVGRLNVRSWLPRLMLAAAPAWLAYTEYRDYLNRSPLEITARRYNSRDFWAQAMGWKAAQVTDPGDSIFVYGSDAGIYYYSRRRCASRFTMILSLGSRYANVEQRRAWLMEDLRRERPRLLFIEGEEPFAEWQEFVRTGYEPIGVDFNDHDPRAITVQVFQDRRRPVGTMNWDWHRGEIGERSGG